MKTRYFNYWQAYQRVYWLFACCMLLSFVITAQEFPYPSAHYPLLMEKYRTPYVLQAWDVSGNARHGNTWNPTTKRYFEKLSKHDYGFTGIPYLGFTFPKHDGPQKNMADIRQRAVLYKPAPEVPGNEVDLHVTIPDPMPDLTSPNLPFSVCFWINVEDITTHQTLIQTPHLAVWLADKKIYVEHASTGTVARSSAEIITSSNTWYFVAISVVYPSYSFYSSTLTGPLSTTPKDASGPFVNVPILSSTSQILGADFKVGSICGVRFYKEPLDQAAINFIKDEDMTFGSNNLATGTPRVGDNHYIRRNMYSFFPFDRADNESIDKMKTNLITRFGQNNALTISNATAVDGMKNNAGGAVKLSDGGRLTLNPFFGDYLDDYNSPTENEEQSHLSPKGFTISFWIKLNDPVTSDRGVVHPPFDDQTPRSRIFGLTDNSQPGAQNSSLIWGYSRINDRLSMRRYNEGVNPSAPHNRYSWDLWHYDPVSFHPAGWYHVVYSQHPSWFKTFIYQPDGTPACQAVLWEIQHALKNNPSTRQWFIGSPGAETQNAYPDLILDNFRIFNWPLVPAEIDALHEMETVTAPATAARHCGCVGDPEPEQEPITQEPDSIIIYPNPATDKITINLKLAKEGPVRYQLTDMQGRIIRAGNQKGNKGPQTIQLEVLNIPNGAYFLQVEAAGLKETKKLIIQK